MVTGRSKTVCWMGLICSYQSRGGDRNAPDGREAGGLCFGAPGTGWWAAWAPGLHGAAGVLLGWRGTRDLAPPAFPPWQAE